MSNKLGLVALVVWALAGAGLVTAAPHPADSGPPLPHGLIGGPAGDGPAGWVDGNGGPGGDGGHATANAL